MYEYTSTSSQASSFEFIVASIFSYCVQNSFIYTNYFCILSACACACVFCWLKMINIFSLVCGFGIMFVVLLARCNVDVNGAIFDLKGILKWNHIANRNLSFYLSFLHQNFVLPKKRFINVWNKKFSRSFQESYAIKITIEKTPSDRTILSEKGVLLFHFIWMIMIKRQIGLAEL